MIEKLSIIWSAMFLAFMITAALEAVNFEPRSKLTLIYPVILEGTQVKIIGMWLSAAFGVGAIFYLGEYLKVILRQVRVD